MEHITNEHSSNDYYNYTNTILTVSCADSLEPTGINVCEIRTSFQGVPSVVTLDSKNLKNDI